jgi:hypothetical protein
MKRQCRQVVWEFKEAKSSFTAIRSAKYQSRRTSLQRRTLEITWIALIKEHCNIKCFKFYDLGEFPVAWKTGSCNQKAKALMSELLMLRTPNGTQWCKYKKQISLTFQHGVPSGACHGIITCHGVPRSARILCCQNFPSISWICTQLLHFALSSITDKAASFNVISITDLLTASVV